MILIDRSFTLDFVVSLLYRSITQIEVCLVLVYVKTPPTRASRTFDKLAQAKRFRERLVRPSSAPRRTAYEEKGARWSVNYYGAGKGSQRARTGAEIRVRVEYDGEGNLVGGTAMPIPDRRPRNKFGLVVGKSARWMEPE